MKSPRVKWKRLQQTVLISIVSFFTAGAFAHTEDHIQANVGFININTLPNALTGISPIRLKALQETASQLGATGALAWRSIQINKSLQKEAAYLDRVFDFRRLLLPHHVLPPVISQASGTLNLASDISIRGDSQTYMLIKPARFVTTAPTWRDYLWMNYSKPSLPNNTLLPTNKNEAIAWNAYLKQGWQEGLLQANAIFEANLSRLKRDYSGMILFNNLLQKHMVTAPYVAESTLGVTGNASELHINDHIARITDPAKLQVNSRAWSPVFTH